jgi:hypothetical protein
MIEVELRIPDDIDTETVVGIVEAVCKSHTLVSTLKSTLATYPGSIHWHFKKSNQKGTLEITWWESEPRLWFKVSSGRTGEWIDEIIPALQEEIEKALL